MLVIVSFNYLYIIFFLFHYFSLQLWAVLFYRLIPKIRGSTCSPTSVLFWNTVAVRCPNCLVRVASKYLLATKATTFIHAPFCELSKALCFDLLDHYVTFSLTITCYIDILNATCGFSNSFSTNAFSSPQPSNGWSTFPPTPNSSRSSSPVDDELRYDTVLVWLAFVFFEWSINPLKITTNYCKQWKKLVRTNLLPTVFLDLRISLNWTSFDVDIFFLCALFPACFVFTNLVE